MIIARRNRFYAVVSAVVLAGVLAHGQSDLDPYASLGHAGTISFDFQNVPIDEVLAYIADVGGLSIAVEGDITHTVTLRLRSVLPEEALSVLAKQVGASLEREGEEAYRLSPMPLMSVNYTNAPLALVLAQLSKQSGTNVVVSPKVVGNVNVQLRNVPWRQAFEVVVRTAGYELVEEDGGILRVVTADDLRDQVITRVYELRYVQPPDVYRPLIDSEFAVGGPEDDTSTGGYSGIGAAAGQRGRATGGGGGSGSASQFTLLNSVVNALSKVGRVEYEPSSNSLVVTDIAPRLEEVARVIALIDVPPPQVFVDVRFVSTDIVDFMDSGVDWPGGMGFSAQLGAMSHRLPFNLGGGGFEDDLSIIDDSPTAVSSDAAGFVFGTIDFTQLSAILRVLRRDESTTILQAPRLVTLDNEEATIFVGETVRFAETFSASAQSGQPQRGIREAADSPIAVGFQLLIIPHVVRGTDEVILTLIPEDNSLAGRAGQNIPGFETFTSGNESIDLPQVVSRTVVTKVLVRHGQTLVLGGLIEESESETEDKVPFFGDIPLLGWLFKNHVISTSRQNLLIMLTVMIENTPEDGQSTYRAHRRHEAGRHSPVEYLSRPAEGVVRVDR